MTKLKRESWKRGDIVELRFSMEASRRGLLVSRPLVRGRYDFLADCGDQIWRVQVKSTAVQRHRQYRLALWDGKLHPRYTAKEVDFIAAYCIPEQAWYIIPLEALGEACAAYLGPTSRMAEYREAWHLLLNKPKGCRIELQACAEEWETEMGGE